MEEGIRGLDPSSVLELYKRLEKEKGLTFDLLDAEDYRLTDVCRWILHLLWNLIRTHPIFNVLLFQKIVFESLPPRRQPRWENTCFRLPNHIFVLASLILKQALITQLEYVWAATGHAWLFAFEAVVTDPCNASTWRLDRGVHHWESLRFLLLIILVEPENLVVNLDCLSEFPNVVVLLESWNLGLGRIVLILAPASL